MSGNGSVSGNDNTATAPSSLNGGKSSAAVGSGKGGPSTVALALIVVGAVIVVIGVVVLLVVKFVVLPRRQQTPSSSSNSGVQMGARGGDAMQSAVFNNNANGGGGFNTANLPQSNWNNEASLQAAMFDNDARNSARRPTETYATFPQGGMGAGGFAVLAVLAALALSGFDVAPNSAVAAPEAFEYHGCLVLDRDIDYRFSWGVWNERLRGKMEANVDGYLAFGISPDGTMDASGLDGFGSDIVIGWIGDGECSKGCVGDYSASQHGKPKRDDSNDVTLVSASRVGSRLTIEFERPLNSNDNKEDRDILLGSAINIIFAAQKDSAPKRFFFCFLLAVYFLHDETTTTVSIRLHDTHTFRSERQATLRDTRSTLARRNIHVTKLAGNKKKKKKM